MVTPVAIARGQVFLVDLEPVRGSEIRKVRPCVIVSPNEMNRHLNTFIVAPLTTGSHSYPFRVPCSFQGTAGHVVPDQIRVVDRSRLLKPLGPLDEDAMGALLQILQSMFTT